MDSGKDEPLAYAPLTVSLSPVENCQALDETMRARARAKMNATLDAMRAEVLEDHGKRSWCGAWGATGATGAAGGGVVLNGGGSTGGTGGAPSSVSETNNQVVGVDEPDLVKTDGHFLYLAQSNELRIVAAWPASQTKAVSTLPLGGMAKKLLINQDRVLAFVAKERGATRPSTWMVGFGSDCTYGYDCDFSGDGTATDLVVVDVADRTSPKILRRMSFSGSLIAARSLGATVHTVVSLGLRLELTDAESPNLVKLCSSQSADGGPAADDPAGAALAEIERVRAINNTKIDAMTFDPTSVAREGDRSLAAADCTDLSREASGDANAVTTLVSFDVQSDAPPKLTSILSRAGGVYASTSSLYMSVSHQRDDGSGWYSAMSSDSEASTVHEFRIGQDPSDTAYLGSGVVPGRILNQFSMDEYQGNLRIATTTGQDPDPDVASTISVLRLNAGELQRVGQIDGIAKGEDIRSVRFDGERGYLVSFKKTDPLFVLDLAHPEAPAIVGELKIPGFSTYMHQLDANHLLALGYEADDKGTFAWFNGIQLQVFDVSNPTEPSLLHKKVYGTRGSSSSALTDHLGFTFLRDRNLLTLPMSICDGGGNGSAGKLSFSGVVAMNVSVDGGIVELGRLEEPYPASASLNGFYYNAGCQDWWTDSNSVVTRTVVLDNFLYAVSANRVRVQDLGQLGTDVARVDFPGGQ